MSEKKKPSDDAPAGLVSELIDYEPAPENLIPGQPTMSLPVTTPAGLEILIAAGEEIESGVEYVDPHPGGCVHGRPAGGICPHCIGLAVEGQPTAPTGLLAELIDSHVPRKEDARFELVEADSLRVTELQLDQAVIDKASGADDGRRDGLPWVDIGANKHGYYPAGYPTQDQGQAEADAAFINRARTRWPELVDLTVELQARVKELESEAEQLKPDVAGVVEEMETIFAHIHPAVQLGAFAKLPGWIAKLKGKS